MMFLRSALLLALTALGTMSCGFVYDFEGYGVKPEGSGAGDCAGTDVTSDPLNCGACGIDCAGGTCSDGVCSPVGVTLGQTTSMVASIGDVVFVVQGGATHGTLVTLPVNFTSETQPGLNESVCDPRGFLSVGGGRVHYRPQNPEDLAVCPTKTFIFSCDAASCAKTTYDLPGHINGVAVVGSNLYFTLGVQIHIAELSAEGIPSASPTLWVAEMTSAGEGAYLIDYDAQGDALWWTTFSGDGCIYRKPPQSAAEGAVSCFTQSVTRPGTFLVSPSGDMYVESLTPAYVPIEVYRFNPGMPNDLGPPVFASAALRLAAADNYYVYVYDGGDAKSLVLLSHTSGKERTRVPVLGPVSVDARHPLYVFYTSQGSLYRLRKPPALN